MGASPLRQEGFSQAPKRILTDCVSICKYPVAACLKKGFTDKRYGWILAAFTRGLLAKNREATKRRCFVTQAPKEFGLKGEIQMRYVKKILSVMLVMGTLAATASVQAAAEAPKPAMAKKEAAKDIVLRGDAKCTTCHDEADSPELLAIGKTKHGTRADKRTPECTSCHGDSEKHTNHKGSDKPPKVDRSFKKNTQNSADERNGACTTCHKGGSHTFWATSAHSANDVTCADCHQVHKGGD